MEEKIITHKDLLVWKKSMDLVKQIYKLTQDFPKSEIFVLTSQIRRSAISIPSNIAEGAARNSSKEFVQFLYISLGSVVELETQLLIAQHLEYCNEFPMDSLNEVKMMLLGLIHSMKNK